MSAHLRTPLAENGQGRKLDGADSMTGSEKSRQTNLKIGGATRLAVAGRLGEVGNGRFVEFHCAKAGFG